MSSNSSLNYVNVGTDRKVAFKMFHGANEPTVIFVPGFMSTMEGVKAQSLEKLCEKLDHSYIRFDFEGVGHSPGDANKVCFGHWIEDLTKIVQEVAKDKVLLVGSSMGGWVSLRVAAANVEKIHSLILVAPAVNFIYPYTMAAYNTMSDMDKAKFDAGKLVIVHGRYGDIFLRKSFAEESKNHEFDLEKKIPVPVPVRIIHGVEDPDVPFKHSLALMAALETEDVDVIYRKNGQHQMSEPNDIKLLFSTIEEQLGIHKETAKL